MNREELFEALDEYYRARQLKEEEEGRGWRIAERIVIVLLVIVPAIYLLFKAPIFEISSEKYNFIEATKIVDANLNNQSGEQSVSYAEYYSSLAGFTAIVILVIAGLSFPMILIKNHTKKQAKETIGLIVGLDSLLLTVIQFLR